MNYAARTDTGKVREINEDSFCLAENEHGDFLFAVCDGIGGLNAGEVASRTAVSILNEAFLKAPEFNKDYEVRNFLTAALNQANDAIYDQASSSPQFEGMGTTAVGLLVCKAGSYIFNVGDSRLYADYEDGFIQMTQDHSLLAQLLLENKLAPEEAAASLMKNRLTNALGIWKVFKIDINKIQPDYTQVLICSDGLSSYVPRAQIETAMHLDLSVQEKCDRLISLADRYGGLDNCTVIVAQAKERP